MPTDLIPRIQTWLGRRSAALRLTAAYVAILAIISLIFSLALYRLSSSQLHESLRHQYVRLHVFPNGNVIVPQDPAAVADELDAGQRRLKLDLLYFNLIIISLGSGASYWLAKRTVRPIEQALATQTRFTADASHELRTPLTAMQTEIEVALRDQEMPPAQARELLQSNLEEIAKLRALADGLLRLARHDHGDVPLEPVDWQAVAQEATGRVAPLAAGRRISLDNQAAALMVLGDAPSLAELVTILLDNAIKYSEPGTTVQLKTRAHGRSGLLSVTDHGRGIAPADLPRIFDRFYRADAARSKADTEGYGLGLSIAQQIARLHHGDISVVSQHGRGTTFSVRIPLAPAPK